MAQQVPAVGEPRPVPASRSMGMLVAAISEYAIFSIDPSGAIETWNAGARRINGFTETEIIGRHFSIFYPEADRRAGAPDRELTHATTHGHWSGEGWRVRRDGSVFWANIVTTAVFGENRELGGFVNITRDESDHRIAAEDRRQADLLLERERIALVLCDTTVREIFSAALALDSARGINTHPEVAERIESAIGTLDGTLKLIRLTVNGLSASPDCLTAPVNAQHEMRSSRLPRDLGLW